MRECPGSQGRQECGQSAGTAIERYQPAHDAKGDVPTLVVLSLDMGAIVLSFAALSFLGIGVQVGYADWGQIVSHARDWILSLDTYWYIIVFPGLVLLLYGLGWNLVGDGLRDVMDPKMRRAR